MSGSYFPMLGLRPALGRLFTPADDEPIGAHPVAVLSYAYWQGRLGGDPAVLGKSVIINGHAMTVIGVAPRGFDGTVLGRHPLVFVPIAMRARLNARFDGFTNRRNYWAYLLARLKPGVTLAGATLAINRAYRAIISNVEALLQTHLDSTEFARFRAKQLVLTDGGRGVGTVRDTTGTPLRLMLAAAGIVVLIACANIASLLLARGAGRAADIALRMSLGATRGRLVTQLLIESLMLAGLGGVVSLIVAVWTLGALQRDLPADVAAAFHAGLRPGALAFAAALSIGTGILFGLFPALQASRPELATAIRGAAGRHSGSRAAARLRGVMVTTQIALSLALLSTAGLLVTSLRNVTHVRLGLDAAHVVTFGISPRLNGYDGPRAAALFLRTEQTLAALPGVAAVTGAEIPLLAGDDAGNALSIDGLPDGPGLEHDAYANLVGPGYFRTIGTPVLAGREFTDADVVGSPKVAVVNEAFLREFHLGRDVIGRHMAEGYGAHDIEIVGVVRDARYTAVKRAVQPTYFMPYRQDPANGSLSLYVRTTGPTDQLLREIPRVMATLDRNLPVEGLKTLEQQIHQNVALDWTVGALSSGFAGLATLLAAVGLYGLLAYAVARRTREFGIRQALGATAWNVRVMVLKQVGVLLVMGGVAGLGGAVAIGRAARTLLYGVGTADLSVFALATAILAAVGLSAGYVPSVRASRVAPSQALRDQ